MKYTTAHIVLLVCLFCIMLWGFEKTLSRIYAATTAKTTVTQVILPNKLGLTIPLSITFSPIVSGITGSQTSTALLHNIEMTDTRSNTDVGWAVSMLCSDFTAINQPVLQKGKNNTVSTDGEYFDSQAGSYIVTITKPGDTGTARFTVTGLETTSGITGTHVAIGTRGVMALFAHAAYTVGDSWRIRIDTIPVQNLTVIPQNLIALTGEKGETRLGPKHAFASKNDPATLLLIPSGQTNSSFTDDLLFSLNIPSFTFANTYKARLTITSD